MRIQKIKFSLISIILHYSSCRFKKPQSPLTCHKDQNRRMLYEENSEEETICPESSYSTVHPDSGKNINKMSRINKVIESGLMRERGGFSPERNPRVQK